ncbi:GT2 family glycosyltransferase [Bacillus oleivorans]|uniref:GT2 family glycosyltransferase n=1 Tax=Bacillus oleivorans TaxID=1448271 RepID=A0A285CHK5_9BACI|nr:glycosyltransferase [Bacillus oleivorans]SNX67082.1 GT2 family glycosyltransferase [Bacillus oleivorans]
MKIPIKLVLVVLCYRETEDIKKMLDSIRDKRKNISVILVNSYYDESTKESFQKIANEHNTDFINIENKGYGYGNNRGIEYANNHYEYEYLGICNPDIKFNRLPLEIFTEEFYDSIIAPRIITKTEREQNPYYYSHLKVVDWLKYIAFKRNYSFAYYAGVAINKVYRETRLVIEKITNRSKTKIYACHGSCFFIGYKAANKIGVPYNEEMFLFHEEEHLARIARNKNIPTVFIKDINIKHFEDGSSVDIKKNGSISKYMKQSYITFYNYWNKN